MTIHQIEGLYFPFEDFFKDYYLLSKKDIINDIKLFILTRAEEIYNQIKEELEHYKNT
jgi:hypothetical protein